MINVNEENFKNEVLNGERVLVDFNATWCGPCRMLKPVLEEFSKDSQVKIVSVDIDENENLAREYNVHSIPCLVIFNNNKEEKRSIGLIGIDELKEFVGE